MGDILRRYFVSNAAPILSIRRQPNTEKTFVPMRCANSRGFWWKGWFVQWRAPYSDAWGWNPARRAWEIQQERQP